MKVMVVGEAPGEREIAEGRPFVGKAGELLTELLSTVGVDRDRDCFITNVARLRPANNDIGEFFEDKSRKKPKQPIIDGCRLLAQEITNYDPDVILAFGNTALWALTSDPKVWEHGADGLITKWRGSQLWTDRVLWINPLPKKYKFVPSFHPAGILRNYSWRPQTLTDISRAIDWANGKRLERERHYTIRPKYEQVATILYLLHDEANRKPVTLSCDIETRLRHTACFGLAWDRDSAMCIPFMLRHGSYWSEHEEIEILLRLRRLLRHPNVSVVGQNFLYDEQYNIKHWGLKCRVKMDAMVAHALCWPGTPKGLDNIASIYAEHYVYWKDEGKLFDLEHMDEDQLWTYNCMDAAYTFECATELETLIEKSGLVEQHKFMLRQYNAVLSMMLRGVKRDEALKSELLLDCYKAIGERNLVVETLLGHSINPRSPKQVSTLFYSDLKQRVVINRKTKKPTTDDDAIQLIASREPLLTKLCFAITEQRALGSAAKVIDKRVDTDGRIRCSYNIVGTVTFRYNSSENAFDSGTNLQNITAGYKSEKTGLEIPNIRKMLIPDSGKLWVDADLEGADAQVVIWEANDDDLKAVIRTGIDLHLYNARDVFQLQKHYSVDDLRDPEIKKRLAIRFYSERQATKVFVHATDYGGKARTVAAAIGLPVREVELRQRIWFDTHPGIQVWHDRVAAQLNDSRTVYNKFGFRCVFFDHVESILPEALAWIPQSTVALVIDHGLVNLFENRPDVDLLLQVHDSLDLQVDRGFSDWKGLRNQLLITVPYDDPLIIPINFKVSAKSWGDCETLIETQL